MKYIWLMFAVLCFFIPVLVDFTVHPLKWLLAVMSCMALYYVHWGFDMMQQAIDKKCEY